VPKHAHGTASLDKQTSSSRLIIAAVMSLYDSIVNPNLLIRRITLTANRVINEKDIKPANESFQLDLFTDYEAEEKKREKENAELQKEKQMQKAVLDIKKKFGKNAILKGMNLEEDATAIQRNAQIGGHKA
jgi:DNA polymerase V